MQTVHLYDCPTPLTMPDANNPTDERIVDDTDIPPLVVDETDIPPHVLALMQARIARSDAYPVFALVDPRPGHGNVARRRGEHLERVRFLIHDGQRDA